jgi:hypothetical protein
VTSLKALTLPEHNAFVMNATTQMRYQPVWVVMCSDCGWRRHREVFRSLDRGDADQACAKHKAQYFTENTNVF